MRWMLTWKLAGHWGRGALWVERMSNYNVSSMNYKCL